MSDFFFNLDTFPFLVVKVLIYLNRRVFLMNSTRLACLLWTYSARVSLQSIKDISKTNLPMDAFGLCYFCVHRIRSMAKA